MGKGIGIAILSFIMYLTNLFGGGTGQPSTPMNVPSIQQSYSILGQTGQVLAKQVTLRQAPQNEAEAIDSVREREQIIILDQKENWYKIRLKTGSEGWIPQYAVSILPTDRKTNKKIVLGYYPVNDNGYQVLLGQAEHLTAITPFGWRLNSYGQIDELFDPQKMGQSLYFAGNQEIETIAMISFPEDSSRFIDNKYLQETTISNILATLENWGLKGVMLEIPSTKEENLTKLLHYVSALASQLSVNNMQILVSLPWGEDVDYAAFSTEVDYVVLRNPNQYTNPGPLTSALLLEEMLEEVVKTLPVNKTILALPNVGFDWSKTGNPSKLSHKEILELAAEQGASIKWDANAKSPYFHYGSGNEVWFENRYSLNYKFDLINKYDLAGVALSELGYEDPEIWRTLAKNF